MNEHTSRWTQNLDHTNQIAITAERRRGKRISAIRAHETEEEAINRRFHDAQRMARFRAKKKKEQEQAKALEASKLSEMALISELRRRNVLFQITNASPQDSARAREAKREVPIVTITPVPGQSKYSQLLSVIEELGRDIKLSYAGSKSSTERLKTGIVQARMLVRDCLIEVNSRQ